MSLESETENKGEREQWIGRRAGWGMCGKFVHGHRRAALCTVNACVGVCG